MWTVYAAGTPLIVPVRPAFAAPENGKSSRSYFASCDPRKRAFYSKEHPEAEG